MGHHLKKLVIIFLCFALHSNVVVYSSTTQNRCVHSQKLALAHLRALTPHAPATTHIIGCWNDYSMKVIEWNMEEDCCTWDGVSCDPAGYVIELDLSFSMPSPHIFPIFNLHHLQTLNLACNPFNHTPFPSGFEKLRNLTHLNLSHTSFSGQIPVGISMLTRLVSLDLSWMTSFNVELRKPNLESFIMNLNSLKEVYLDGVDLSAQGSNWSLALSSTALPHLEVLRLSDCRLNGPIHPSFANLKSLSYLELSYNNLSSEVPTILEDFMNLETLNLVGCELYGDFPKNVFRLPKLRVIDISGNKLLRGQFPEFPKHSSLQMILLPLTDFHGELPQSIGNLLSLKFFHISYCNFWGSIPSSLANLTSIIELDIRENRFTGSLPPFHSTSVPNLSYLDMSSNLLTGRIDSTVFTLPSLAELRLKDNKFSGELEEFSNTSSSVLELLYLNGNHLRGVVPKSIFELPNLFHLSLASNNFNSSVKFGMFGNLKNLVDLDISGIPVDYFQQVPHGNNSFVSLVDLVMRSCNISKFPEILKGLNALESLDLSDNKIEGEIPSWIWKNKLGYVNISHNLLSDFDEHYPNSSLKSMYALYLHGNRIKGSFPSTICNMSSLEILDASDNNLGGLIPECLAKFTTVSVLNLKENRYHQMPFNFTFAYNLQTLNINGNRLKGKLPRSLANCKSLKILDLGNNMISDTFPFWLVKLPSLKVLILRNNMFYDQVKIPGKKYVLPNLRIVDLSSNNLTGELSRDFLQSLSAMAMTERNKSKNGIIGKYDKYYRDSVTIENKGYEMELVKILTIYVSLDLSNNKFHGNVPEEIGELKLLVVLNLSRNAFNGRIPTSLGDLSQLESLDFSHNKFSGMIPPQLTSLTFLEVLNLSYNQLVWRIPLGKQFNTFTNSSYIKNEGLCGIPLSRKCSSENDAPGTQEESLESEEAIFDWRFAVAGCVFGLVVGLIIGFAFLAELIINWLVKHTKKQPHRRRDQGGP